MRCVYLFVMVQVTVLYCSCACGCVRALEGVFREKQARTLNKDSLFISQVEFVREFDVARMCATIHIAHLQYTQCSTVHSTVQNNRSID